jgi:hypothetical protein
VTEVNGRRVKKNGHNRHYLTNRGALHRTAPRAPIPKASGGWSGVLAAAELGGAHGPPGVCLDVTASLRLNFAAQEVWRPEDGGVPPGYLDTAGWWRPNRTLRVHNVLLCVRLQAGSCRLFGASGPGRSGASRTPACLVPPARGLAWYGHGPVAILRGLAPGDRSEWGRACGAGGGSVALELMVGEGGCAERRAVRTGTRCGGRSLRRTTSPRCV